MKNAVLMDPIDQINPKKDTSLAILLAAQKRGWKNFIFGPDDIWLQDGIVWAQMQALTVFDHADCWYELGEQTIQPLSHVDLLFMRKDPPFNMDFLYLTYLLELAESQGVLVINKPASLRDANEKLFAAWFKDCCPKTLVTSKENLIIDFLSTVNEAVIKPLDGMGGQGVFRLNLADHNRSAIIEAVTQKGTRKVMVQSFIPEIIDGDKRILMINGEPLPHVLARVPAPDDFRGNLAAGATAVGRPLTAADRKLCDAVGPTLREKGLVFVGLDVIGEYITEINVTSPTCVRQLDALFDLDIAGDLLNVAEKLLLDAQSVDSSK